MIEFRNVTVIRKKRTLIKGLSLKLNNGKRYGICGDAETSSLVAELLSGATLPTDGQVLINGFDLLRESAKAKAPLSYLPANLLPYQSLTPVEYLLFLADVRQIEYEKGIREIGNALSVVSLSGKRDLLIKHLSPYEKRCLAIAGTLIGETEILIFNDPFCELSPAEAERLSLVLEDVTDGKTAVFCTTSSNFIHKMCDLVYTCSRDGLCLDETSPINKTVQSNETVPIKKEEEA